MNLTSFQVSTFRTGLGASFENMQAQLASEVFAENLPVVGANLATLANAAPSAGNAGVKKIAAVKAAVDANLAALSGDLISDAKVLKAVNDALSAQGFAPKAKLIGGGALLVDFSDVAGSGAFSAPVAADLGMAGLDLALTGPATAKGTVNYDFNFQAGLDGGDVFFLQQNDGAELNVALDVDAGAFKEVNARMGNLPYLVSAADANLLGANFAVQLDGAGNVTAATVQSGAATPKLKLLTNFGTGAAMPGVGSTLDVAWDLAGATLDADPNNAAFGAVPEVSFNNIGLDPGKFVSDVAGQFFGNITTYLAPIIKVADTLSTPIPGIGPILNKLGLGGTLIDIIAGPDSPSAKAVKQLAALGDVVQTLNKLSTSGGTLVDFGSFSFTTDGGGADIRSAAFSLGNVTPNLTSTGGGAAGSAALTNLGSKLNESLGSALQLPILNGPGELFKFVLGQPANLITYNPGPITAGLDFNKAIPVFPGVNVGITVGGTVNFNIELGFDTRGIVDFASGGFSDASQLLNGLFLTDFAGTPEMFFEMRIGATASLGIPGIAEGGIEGGIRGNINGDFKDNFSVPGHPELANDGKLSFQEIAHQFSSSVNPLNLFEISGRIEAYLAAYLEFLFYSKRFDLGSFTIFDFEAEKAAAANTPAPILAGADPFVAGGIRVNIGDRANLREAGANGDLGESIRIRPVFNEKGVLVPNQVVVTSAATTALDGSNLGLLGGDVSLVGTQLFAGGGGGADVFRVSDDVKLPLYLIGDAGRDFIQGGAGNDTLFGGLDDDQIFGGSGNDSLGGIEHDDELYGGGGKDTIQGGSGNDVLHGDDGNDELFGGAEGFTTNTGNDSMFGGAGNDTLNGTLGSDLLDGGTGNDLLIGGGGTDVFIVDSTKDKIIAENASPFSVVRSRAAAFTLPDGLFQLTLTTDLTEDGTEVIHKDINGTGNDLNNRILGNDGANVISGLAGNDTILGNAGDDSISGGDGDDELEGDAGNDKLLGGLGQDSLYGEDGDDFLDGGDGVDTLSGGLGNDAYVVTAGDSVFDSGGFDLVASGDSVDLSTGGGGGIEGVFLFGTKNSNATGNGNANRIVGNSGKNMLSGLGGDDTLEGGNGDTLTGGQGNDTYRVGHKKVVIVEDGGGIAEGTNDTVLTAVTFTLPANVESLILADAVGPRTANGNDGANTIIVAHKGTAFVDGFAGNDSISANFLGFSTFAATIYGGRGDDIITGSDFDDSIFGHSPLGDDNFSDDDSIDAGLGHDRIFAGKGSDTVNGGDGDDYIHTLAREISTLSGGLGDDTYEVAAGGIFNVLLIDESSGGGVDRIISAVDVDLRATRVGGGTVALGDIEIVELTGSALNATGDLSANILYGNSGNNVLAGLAGADTIFGESGNDTLDGRDFFSATASRDELYGGKGDDLFHISDSLDAVVELPNEGRDRVESSVNFTLSEHVEDLFLSGSAANGAGNFRDNLLRGNSQPNVLTALAGNDTVFGGDSGDTIFGGDGKDELRGQAGNDSIEGGAGNDKLMGNDGGDTLRGGGGNDTLYGQAEFNSGGDDFTDDGGADVLFGDDGNDQLIGFGGDDTLDGGHGSDGMSGGTGNDSYYVDSPGDVVFEIADAGIDSVRSSVSLTIPANVETLLLTGSANLNAAGSKNNERVVGNVGNNLIASSAGADTLEGGNGRDTLLGGDGDDALFGDLPGFVGSGDDFLDGGAGNDFMAGGFGNDTFIVDSSGDTVSEQAGQGFDTIRASVGYTLPLSVEELIYTGTKGVTLSALGGAQRIFGGPKNDTLIGGNGADTMSGGLGDDTYFVDDAGDRVSESLNSGSDRVFVLTGSHVLGDNVENLTLVSVAGAGTTDGTGNDLANEIIGSTGSNRLDGGAGNDTLNGGGGADILDGGFGDDTYIVSDTLAVIQDLTGQGYDKLIVNVNGYRLSAMSETEEIQIGTLAGVSSVTGNEIANVIRANNAGCALNGGTGSDTLIGGAGKDYLTGCEDLARGGGEIDVLTGGAGDDWFYLGDSSGVFYDDANADSAGKGDFALITDFKPADGDKLIFFGTNPGIIAALTGVTANLGTGNKFYVGIGIFRDFDNDGTVDATGSPDELLALIHNFTAPGLDFADYSEFLQV